MVLLVVWRCIWKESNQRYSEIRARVKSSSSFLRWHWYFLPYYSICIGWHYPTVLSINNLNMTTILVGWGVGGTDPQPPFPSLKCYMLLQSSAPNSSWHLDALNSILLLLLDIFYNFHTPKSPITLPDASSNQCRTCLNQDNWLSLILSLVSTNLTILLLLPTLYLTKRRKSITTPFQTSKPQSLRAEAFHKNIYVTI